MTGQVDALTVDNANLGSSQPVLNYVDLRVRIRAKDDHADAYPVEAWITDSHGASNRVGGAYFVPDWSRLRDVESDPEAYGQDLFYTLFSGAMASVYDRAAGLAEATTENRLRLHIWIADDAPELHAIYWERMHHQRAGMATPVSAVTRTPFSRYVDVDLATPEPDSLNFLRLLYVCSNPLNLQSKYHLVPIDVETEVRELIAALKSLRHSRRLSVTILPGITGISPSLREVIADLNWICVDGLASVSAVTQHLADAPGYQVLHFLGHGKYSQRDTAATLYFEGRSGNAHIVKDKELGSRLMALARAPDLVFLAACESAKRHPELGYPQVGFAPQLIRAGVKAVVAMQDTISTHTARTLTTEFYQSVLDNGIVDVALNQARFAVHTEEQRDWWVPVLATRLQDGVLFKPDMVRSMLDAMTDSKLFDPLPDDADYIPCEVTHTSNAQFSTVSSRSQSEEIGWVFDRVLGIPGDVDFPVSQDAPVVVLSGAGGMGKSIQLKRLGYTTAADAWYADRGPVTLPVYVDVNATQIATINNLKTSCFDMLKSFQDDLDEQTATSWLEGDGPTLRFLFDGMDVIPDSRRAVLWRLFASFISAYPQHQYVIAYHERIEDLVDFQTELVLAGVTKPLDVVQIQPLSELVLNDYLRTHSPEAGQLAQVIADKQLTSVAVLPWVLVKLLDAARRKRYPASKTALIGDLLEQALEHICPDLNMRLAALRSLYAIAYALQTRQTMTLDIDAVFAILRDIRGNREYSLETMFMMLCKANVLSLLHGQDVRFTRNIFQQYCCAMALKENPDAQALVLDISATFGVASRLRWWGDVFVFLAGLGCNVDVLLQQLLFGNTIHSSGMLVLAARVVQECDPHKIDMALRQYVMRSVVHQLDVEQDGIVGIQLVDTLAGFGLQDTCGYLTSIALGMGDGESSVGTSLDSRIRLQAVNALRRLDSPEFSATAQASEVLADLLRLWERGDVAGLAQYVVDQDVVGGIVDTQSVAIFALADMRSATAFDIMMQAFVYPGANEQTLQSITAAVALMNPDDVLKRLLVAYIEKREESPFSRLNEEHYYRLRPYILSMIAQVNIHDTRLQAFAKDAFYEDSRVDYKLVAMSALGALRDLSMKTVLEQVALRDLSAFGEGQTFTDADVLRMQRTAIQALTSMADEATLKQLAPVLMSSDVGSEIYRLTEAVLWRQHIAASETQ